MLTFLTFRLCSGGATREDVLRLIDAAIAFHLDDLREVGAAVPLPHSSSVFVEVKAA